MSYNKELQIAKRAAKDAGEFLMKKFQHPHENKISFKEKREIVTEADIGADKLITKIIKSAFPSHYVISEELSPSKHKADNLWFVDPLDGTKNFAHGIPIFAVCIAFAQKGDLKVGVVYLPYSKEMFWAVKDGGAYLGNKKISLSKISKLKDAFILQCYRSTVKSRKKYLKIFKSLGGNVLSTRHLGAAGYELTSVARGHVSAGYIIGIRPWDAAAGALIVREAGGKATNFKGREWALWDKNILFSNEKIHTALLKIVRK